MTLTALDVDSSWCLARDNVIWRNRSSLASCSLSVVDSFVGSESLTGVKT